MWVVLDELALSILRVVSKQSLLWSCLHFALRLGSRMKGKRMKLWLSSLPLLRIIGSDEAYASSCILCV
jgi:hypothetical protein